MITKNIDGKKIIIKGNPKNIPSIDIIKKVYAKIPDDKNIPIVFQTKSQYLDEYVKNQEKVRGKPFPKKEVNNYKNKELHNMQNIVSRYTTKHNPFIDTRTVFFTDQKITPKQFEKSAFHEYGHEAWENNPRLRKAWDIKKTSAPTSYGTKTIQEDVAESYMLYKTKQLRDPKRQAIIGDTISNNKERDTKIRESIARDIIRKMQSDNPEEIREGLKQQGIIQGYSPDFSEFDMNNDGKINDIDIDIMKKKGIVSEKNPKRDTHGKNNVGEALGYNIPESILDSASWKLYGLPKQYDPRIQERANLKGNIFKLTKEHYNTLYRSPLSNYPIIDINSQDLSLKEVGEGIGKGLAYAKQRLSRENLQRTYVGADRPHIGSDQKVRILPAASAGLKWTAGQVGKGLMTGGRLIGGYIPPEIKQKLIESGQSLKQGYGELKGGYQSGYDTTKTALDTQMRDVYGREALLDAASQGKIIGYLPPSTDTTQNIYASYGTTDLAPMNWGRYYSTVEKPDASMITKKTIFALQ